MVLTETQREAVVGVLPAVNRAARLQARNLPERVRDDAVCEAMLAVCEAIQRYDIRRGSWDAFANITARSRVTDYARVWLGRQGSKVAGQLKLDFPSPERSVEDRELLRAVVALPMGERVCLIHGATAGARILGITVPAAQSRRYRALQHLAPRSET
jgi:DNA-directed RNA polymerase specialized sigma24 family protein